MSKRSAHGTPPGPQKARETIAESPHGHGGAHPPAELDRIQSGKIVFVGVAALVVFFVASLFTMRHMRKEEAELRPQGAPPFPAELGQPKIGILEQRLFENSNQARVTTELQRRKLATAGWVDRAQGIVRLPIDRGIELVLKGERPPPLAPAEQTTSSGGETSRGLGDAPGAAQPGRRGSDASRPAPAPGGSP